MADLTDHELDELDDLLARTPEPLEPLDVAMLDGYLGAVLVMPRLLAPDEWLPPVFDLEGGELPADADPAWRARVAELAQRRLDALREQIVEDGWFDPVLLAHDADDAVHAAADAVERDALAELKPASRPLFSWVAGFQYGTARFADVLAAAEADVAPHVERVFRHLPPETDEDRAANAALDAELPIATVDDAVADLVAAVVDLWEASEEQRFRVAPVRRDVPKVGRNEPCPCGSGRKYKHCHGG